MEIDDLLKFLRPLLGAMDQAQATETRADVLVYTSEPFASGMELRSTNAVVPPAPTG